MATADSNPFNVSVAAATPLAAAAASMAPGSWATFTTLLAGATSLSDLLDSGGGKRIVEYSDKMLWLSGRREIHFTGCGHLQTAKTIMYTDANNTWNSLGEPPWFTLGNFLHAYQHNTGRGNTHYFLNFGTNPGVIHVRDIPTGNWTLLNNSGLDLGTAGAQGAMEWFPTFGSGGSLIVVNGQLPAVYRWNGSSWSNIGSPAMGDHQNIGVYSPIKDLMYLGGGAGSTKLYTMSNTGLIKAAAAPPAGVGGIGVIDSITTVDPVSGKLVVLTSGKAIFVYDPSSNSWSTETSLPPDPGFWSGNIYSEGNCMGIVAAPIYDYGVTMFLTIAGPTIYLRKGR